MAKDELIGIKNALRYIIQKDIDNEIQDAISSLKSYHWRMGERGLKDRDEAIKKRKLEIMKKYKKLMDGLK